MLVKFAQDTRAGAREAAQRLGRKGTTAAVVPAAPRVGVKMCRVPFLPLYLRTVPEAGPPCR